jgi:hypothetical protein
MDNFEKQMLEWDISFAVRKTLLEKGFDTQKLSYGQVLELNRLTTKIVEEVVKHKDTLEVA